MIAGAAPHNLILNAQTLPAVSFDVRVAAARSAGYRGLSLRALDYRQAIADGFDDGSMLAMLQEARLEVTEIGFASTWMKPGRLGRDDDEETLWHMASLFRPRQLNAGLWDAHDPNEGADAFAALCDRAGAQGLLVALEFIPHSGIRDLEAAWRMVRTADRPNAGLILDAWHMWRNRTPVVDITAVPAARWLTLQLADTQATAWPDVRQESRHGRLLPGEGAVDFAEMIGQLRRIGAAPLVSVEVISDALHALDPAETARRSADASMTVLRRCHLEPPWWTMDLNRNLKA